jgi:hypothetical protein
MNNKLLDMYIALQPKFREVMGDWRHVDCYWCPTCQRVEYVGVDNNMPGIDAVRLPLTIDDSSEEAHKRSLWGMLKGGKSLGERGDHIQLFTQAENKYHKVFTGSTPTEAILKALLHQWGGR